MCSESRHAIILSTPLSLVGDIKKWEERAGDDWIGASLVEEGRVALFAKDDMVGRAGDKPKQMEEKKRRLGKIGRYHVSEVGSYPPGLLKS